MLFHGRKLRRDAGGEGGGGTSGPPMMTVKHGDQEIQVPRPAGYFTQEEIAKTHVPVGAHNDQMARLRKDLDSLKGARKPDELLGDDQFKATALEKWGLNPTATQAEFQKQLARQKDEITATVVNPLNQKLEKATSQIQQLRLKDLRGQIMAATAGKRLVDGLITPLAQGHDPAIVGMLGSVFGFDEERGDWFVKGASPGQWQFSTRGDSNKPYMTVDEFMEQWAAGPGKGFVKPEKQDGANADAGAGGDGAVKVPGQVGKELRLTSAQIRDSEYFRKAKAQADKEGLTIVNIG